MKTITKPRLLILWLGLLPILLSAPIAGFATELATTPLATSTINNVQPNLMFVIDDSGSMAWEHMPDVAGDAGSSVTWNLGYYGARSSQCNGVYYNPSFTYSPPIKADQTYYPNANFTSTYVDGYKQSGTVVNLSTSYKYTDSGATSITDDSTGAPAYYFKYTGSQTTPASQDFNSTSNTFYQECSSGLNATPGSDVFSKVEVSATSGPGGTDERTNFANWYSYYRTRMLLMKTSAGLAFKNMDNHYRIGFMAINSGTAYLAPASFEGAQRTNWYAKLYGIAPSGSTPLRTALADLGKFYAHKPQTDGTTLDDPVQYSCQQNFGILSSDGYWNSGKGSDLAGNNVGNQDGTVPRPYYDGTTVTVKKSTSQKTMTQTQLVKSTSQNQSRTVQIQSATSKLQQQTSQLQKQVSQLQKQTKQLQKQTTQLQKSTSALEKCSGTATQCANGTKTWSTTTSTCTVSGTVQCRYAAWTNWAGASSCTPKAQSAGSPYAPSAVQCQTVVTTAYTGSSSCTPTTTPNASGYTYQCQTVTTSDYAGASSCAANATPDASGNTTQCQTVITSPYAGSASCNANGTPDSNGNTTQCQTVITSAFANAESCNANTTPDASGNTTQCQYAAWTAFANANSCTQLDQSSGPNYTVGTATKCQSTDTGWVNVLSCNGGTTNGATVTCQTNTTGPTPIGSCTAASPTSPNYITTTCVTNTLASNLPVESCTASSAVSPDFKKTTCATLTTGPTVVDGCTSQAATAENNWMTVICTTTTTGNSADSLADLAQYFYMTDLRSSDLGNCTGAAGGSGDVCKNDVPSAGQDGAAWQHLTLFTMGLGARGKMLYSHTYLSDATGDYPSVANGTLANPPSVCGWQTSGACNWPIPGTTGASDTGDGKIENLDDLWHAAVNGRGTFYSAKDPSTLASGLSSALAGVSARRGSASSATTSTSTVTLEDNFIFLTEYTTGQWDGNLIRQQINVSDGSSPEYNKDDPSTYDWSAQSLLDTKDLATRKVYYSKSGTLAEFKWDQLTGTDQGYFSLASISSLSQFCSVGKTCLSADNQASAAGANLVAFLRGDRTNEGDESDTTKFYRKRVHILGDLANSEPNYVPAPYQEYSDTGYANFKSSHSSRQTMVYVGGNDGMLHAFNASTDLASAGKEVWAFIPSMVLPKLYKLADKNYANLHQYFVDGSPAIGDVCVSNCTSSTNADWRTILVGGLNGGGKGYYALDITDPNAPQLLWEFTNTNMGYSYGNPIITKIKPSNTWVVMVSSGYNNNSPGDGVGRLFVLNAGTGAIISTLSTGAGGTSTPSGLAKISAWGDGSSDNNTASRVYGGDTLGNLWRFNVEGAMGVQLLATLKNPSGGVQPITAKPELGKVNDYPVVFVGTGQYLGVADESDTSVQSVYALKDPLTTSASAIYDNPRSNTCSVSVTTNCMVKQTISTLNCEDAFPSNTNTSGICLTGETVRQTVATSVDIKQKNGWYFDLPDAGERVNTDLMLALGTLLVNSNTPEANACTTGGTSFRYFVDYRNGGSVGGAVVSTTTTTTGGGGGGGTGGDGTGGGTGTGTGSGETTTTTTTGVTGHKISNAIASAPTLYQIPSGKIIEGVRLSDATYKSYNMPYNAKGNTVAKRVSWREVIIDR